MANICDTYIYAKGNKKDLENLKKVFKNQIEYGYVSDIEKHENEYLMHMNIGLRWSFYLACIDSLNENYKLENILKNNPSLKLNIATLEPGMEFSEHFLCDKDNVYIDEVNDYIEDYNDDEDKNIYLKFPSYFIENKEENYLYLDEDILIKELNDLKEKPKKLIEKN